MTYSKTRSACRVIAIALPRRSVCGKIKVKVDRSISRINNNHHAQNNFVLLYRQPPTSGDHKVEATGGTILRNLMLMLMLMLMLILSVHPRVVAQLHSL